MSPARFVRQARGDGCSDARVVRAGIFDLDGVLADSGPPHDLHRSNALIPEAYRARSVTTPGVTRLLSTLRTAGFPLAVVSSSRCESVEVNLDSLGIRHCFDAVVGGDLVDHGEPDPAVYLLAAQRLGVPPADCFVVGDSPGGIAAARAAGMLTIAVQPSYGARSDTPHAHFEVRSLEDIDCRSHSLFLTTGGERAADEFTPHPRVSRRPGRRRAPGAQLHRS